MNLGRLSGQPRATRVLCGQAVLSVIRLHFCVILEVGKVENMKNRTDEQFGKT